MKKARGFKPGFYFNSGNFLLSHTLARAVPSGLWGLTTVFGMGTGGTPTLRSPKSGLWVVGSRLWEQPRATRHRTWLEAGCGRRGFPTTHYPQPTSCFEY